MDWLRWWHGTVTDPKFQRVARAAGVGVGQVIAVWACLLERASSVTPGDARVTQGDAKVTRGSVTGFDCADHDVLLGFEDGTAERVMVGLIERGLIVDGRIARWEERQPKREDSSTARMRDLRARRKGAGEVTASDAGVTPGDAPEKSRGDKSNTPSSPPGDAPAAPPQSARKPKAEPKPRSKPKHQLPVAFVTTTQMMGWAKETAPDVNLERETERFMDHFRGTGESKADWGATWRNWMRRAQDDLERRGMARRPRQAPDTGDTRWAEEPEDGGI
ncbi:hypothetical protein [Pseudomonas sp. SO81]|uniref:hypothetical protein n=1 Tax=Pseudomonas sp. SO81 TaxID=2983246 RepID=UPI0025A3C28B|nr:hypothetical protein [Pseudomonas sp. SO81]WJN61336.1 hypothetical protein OH686_21545 [Pseudomonas sp. SO81]